MFTQFPSERFRFDFLLDYEHLRARIFLSVVDDESRTWAFSDGGWHLQLPGTALPALVSMPMAVFEALKPRIAELIGAGHQFSELKLAHQAEINHLQAVIDGLVAQMLRKDGTEPCLPPQPSP